MTPAAHVTSGVAALPNASLSAAAAPGALTSLAGTTASKVRDPTIRPASPRILAANSTWAVGAAGVPVIWKLRISIRSW